VLTLGLVGAVAASLLISPAGAHITTFGHLKGHIKKIARKVARREARTIVTTTIGPTIFIEETELTRFGPFALSATSADVTIGTFGPFTLKAHCDEDPVGTLEGEILISTSQANSAFASDDDTFDTFGPADLDQSWASETDTFPDDGTAELNSEDDENAHAISATGTTAISAAGSTILLNGQAAGAPDCLIAGGILVNVPN
jgi:hypothetical protein